MYIRVDGSAVELVLPGIHETPAGFPADVLWKFRWYSLLNQALIWAAIGLIFSNLVERVVGNDVPARDDDPISA